MTTDADRPLPPEQSLLPERALVVVGAAALTLLGLALRWSLRDAEVDDFRFFFRPWWDAFETRGAWTGLGESFADYTPPYLYLLSLSTLLPVSALTAVKAIALLGDVALAAAVVVWLRAVVRVPPATALVGTALVLLGPSVVLNSGLWGQVDALWVAPVVASLACAATGRSGWACGLLGLALSIKLQAVFFLPFLAVLVLRRHVPLRSLPWLPVGYAVPFLPAVLAGRPPTIVVTIYTSLSGTYPQLTLNAPNLYALLPDRPELADAATLSALGVIGVLVLVCALCVRLDRPVDVLRLALLFALACPWLLPHMHERYFFAADVLAVLYAVAVPRRWWLPVLVVTASVQAYVPYLFGGQPALPFPLLAAMTATACVVVLVDLVSDGAWTVTSRTSGTSRPARRRPGTPDVA